MIPPLLNRFTWPGSLISAALLCGLLWACYLILQPFLPGLIWGGLIVVASWPLMLQLQQRLGSRRRAALSMTLALGLLIITPLLLALINLLSHSGQLINWLDTLKHSDLSTPPHWLHTLPLLGNSLVELWQHLAQQLSSADGTSPDTSALASHGKTFAAWLFSQLGSLGKILLHFSMTLFAAALFYLHGESTANVLRRILQRLAGVPQAEYLLQLTSQAIRGVALGIVVTAIAQSLLGGLGLLIAQIPLAAPLTALMLLLCIAQIGPMPILLPCILWLFWQDHTTQGILLTVLTLAATLLDSFLRPILIRRGANLPLLLILAGVIGGLLAFGLVGLFLGPVLLALSYTTVRAWMNAPSLDEQSTQGL